MIGVVVGGRGPLTRQSHDVGRRVATLIERAGAQAAVLEYGHELLQRLARPGVTHLYDATHGVYGRVPELGRIAGLPVLGSSLQASGVYDKPRLKTFLASTGAMTPPWVTLDSYTADRAGGVLEALGGPLVLKPARADMLSFGVSYVADPAAARDEIDGLLDRIFEVDDTVLAERYVEGQEVCVGFMGFFGAPVEMLPAMTVSKRAKLFDHDVKVSGAYRFEPVSLSDAQRAEAWDIGERLAAGFAISGCWYLNAILGADDRLHVFDVGTTVGLGARSYFPAATALTGVSVDGLLARVLGHWLPSIAAELAALGESAARAGADAGAPAGATRC